jgi:lipopolysaccharide assembly outer membrane protein LptD (OstA)
VQFGAGTHYNIAPRFDLTFKAQYMMHLGNEVHGEVRNGQLEIEEHSHGGLEGHLLITLSVNFKLIRIWTKG